MKYSSISSHNFTLLAEVTLRYMLNFFDYSADFKNWQDFFLKKSEFFMYGGSISGEKTKTRFDVGASDGEGAL